MSTGKVKGTVSIIIQAAILSFKFTVSAVHCFSSKLTMATPVHIELRNWPFSVLKIHLLSGWLVVPQYCQAN